MSGMKDFSVYGSTKFSVTALSEYLREFMSMENLPIRVTVRYLFDLYLTIFKSYEYNMLIDYILSFFCA